VHIISATPGRLLDMINRNIIDISNIKIIVLDEADEMLNMGFRDDLESILKETPGNKNTLLFSATMPQEVLGLANRYMHNPVEITVGRRNSGAENVNHICYMVHAKDRYLALKRIADYNPDIYGIIFCRTRAETQEVADRLLQDGYNAEALHGDLSQPQRDTVMNKFRIKHLRLLVATDVAARGLDVDNLTHIINYNLPDETDLYIHRSGRTGRAGKTGTSIIIANLKEKFKLNQIEKKLNKKFAYLPVPLGKDICEKQLFHLVDKIEKVEVDDTNIETYLPEIYRKLEWLDREELIKKFVSVEFNRFLDYYKNTSDLNIPFEEKRSGKRRSTGAGFKRFFINLGRTDELKPVTLMNMISEFTSITNIEIGDIQILQNFSFFEADSGYAELILKSFENKILKNRQIAVEVASGKKNEKRKEDWRERKPKSGERKPFRRKRSEKSQREMKRSR
jgi:ATP-dependent RNA helicase DeaD